MSDEGRTPDARTHEPTGPADGGAREPAYDPDRSADDLTETAGEYVLGTLPVAERAAFHARLQNDGPAQRAVTFWRERMAPLDAVAAAIAPPDRVWSEIERALPPPVVPPVANDNARLRRSRNGWRAAALAAALVAVGGALIAVNDDVRTRLGLDAPAGLTGGEYVAVVNRDGSLPALVVNVDGASGRVSVRPFDMPAPGEGSSYEMWYVPPGGEPRSVGLVDGPGAVVTEVEAAAGGTFAVTQEPRGGSPTGKATGQMMFSGKLVLLPD